MKIVLKVSNSNSSPKAGIKALSGEIVSIKTKNNKSPLEIMKKCKGKK